MAVVSRRKRREEDSQRQEQRQDNPQRETEPSPPDSLVEERQNNRSPDESGGQFGQSEGNMEPTGQTQDTVDNNDSNTVKHVVYGTQKYPGRSGVIGKHEIEEADAILRKYRQGKQLLQEKIIENENWWQLRHWETLAKVEGKEGYEEPASAWLFNSLGNKHADFMDNIPTPNFLPREESDEKDAQMLQKIVPCILDENKFEQSYSDVSWHKMKQGTGVYGVFWNSSKENGLGDIDIKDCDLKNLYWEPGVKDIQSSQHFFNLARMDLDVVVSTWSFLEGKINSGVDGNYQRYQQSEHGTDENVNDDQKVTVVDWYYKKVNDEGRMIVHYVKYVDDQVIYASENDERYKDTGYYDHGMYPFIFDALYPIEGQPVGFGFIDIMKSPQLYIDKLDQIVLQNAALSGKKRWFVKDGAAVNEEEYADWSKDFVHVSSGVLDDNLKEIQVSSVPSFIVNHYINKIDELKETSGNRDFSQGSTTSGVTAASAIAALQEAGSKLSRDMIKTSYRAFCTLCEMVLELIRQFYTEQRAFRIDKPNGGYEFVRYSNSNIVDQVQIDPITGEPLSRRPVFDIKISAQKQSPFNRTAQNELAKELFNQGVFNPQMATQALPMLEMMEFEGIDKVKQTVAQNGTLIDFVNQIQQLSISMAQQLDMITGGATQFLPQVMQILTNALGQQPQIPQMMGAGAQEGFGKRGVNGLPATDGSLATKARIRAANVNSVDHK